MDLFLFKSGTISSTLSLKMIHVIRSLVRFVNDDIQNNLKNIWRQNLYSNIFDHQACAKTLAALEFSRSLESFSTDSTIPKKSEFYRTIKRQIGSVYFCVAE